MSTLVPEGRPESGLRTGGKYVVKTLGCKANLYDSQLLERELQRYGWKPALSDEDLPDLCIVNSCSVTDDADRQSRRLASRLSRDNPGARVVVTGCSAEIDPERLKASKGIDYVVGNRDKPALVQMVLTKMVHEARAREAGALSHDGQVSKTGEILGRAANYEQMISRHPMDREWPLPDEVFQAPPTEALGDGARTRAFLKIQEGCNSFCTYCIIPYGRGPSRSLKLDEVVCQVETLVAQGVREVVITGTNVGDYGVDWGKGPELVPLFEAILGRTKLERLRVSSLDPVEIEPALMELMKREPRLCAHFHVSLQSAHSRILKLMKRKYAFEQVKACLEGIAQIPGPSAQGGLGGAFVGMDVITGFPGETEEEFEWTCRALQELPWGRLHVFPYSEREGTPATRLPHSVPDLERQRRAKRLRDLSLERLTRIHTDLLAECKKTGSPLKDVLLEGRVLGPDGTRNWIAGYSSNYLRVLVPFSGPLAERQNRILDLIPASVHVDHNAGDVAFIASEVVEA